MMLQTANLRVLTSEPFVSMRTLYTWTFRLSICPVS